MEEKFKALLADPDKEPDDSESVALVQSLPVVERKKKDAQYRFCTVYIYTPALHACFALDLSLCVMCV